MLNLEIIQAYVDIALLEMGIRNTGRRRVRVKFDDARPGLARVPVHAGIEYPPDFAERLASLCHRFGWSAELDGPERHVEITSE